MGIIKINLRKRATLLCALLGMAIVAAPAQARPGPSVSSDEAASPEARAVTDWVISSNDNQGLPFIIVDKTQARLFLFGADGTIRATVPVLLGLGLGDDSPPGIGERKLSTMKPAERITPAGRFFASMGEDLTGQDMLWIDYGAAVSLHRLTDPLPGLTASGREARLASATIEDNRISHGCVNVSVDFFETMVRPAFSRAGGIVYVLPETRSVQAVFPLTSAKRLASSEPGVAGRAS